MATVDLARPINWRSPLNQGLVAWWIALPGASGADCLPEFVNNLTGTAGTGLWSDRDSWGKFEAPTFDGTNDAYTLGGDTTILHLGNKTVVAWVRTTSTELYAEVLSVIGGGFAGYALAFSGSATAGRVAIYALGGGSYIEASSGVANDGVWHQIALTHDSAGAYVLYLDGLPVGSGNAGAASYALSSYFIGGFSGYRWSTFTLGDIRVYNRILDEPEMVGLYEASHPNNPGQYNGELNWIEQPWILDAPPGPVDLALWLPAATFGFSSPTVAAGGQLTPGFAARCQSVLPAITAAAEVAAMPLASPAAVASPAVTAAGMIAVPSMMSSGGAAIAVTAGGTCDAPSLAATTHIACGSSAGAEIILPSLEANSGGLGTDLAAGAMVPLSPLTVSGESVQLACSVSIVVVLPPFVATGLFTAAISAAVNCELTPLVASSRSLVVAVAVEPIQTTSWAVVVIVDRHNLCEAGRSHVQIVERNTMITVKGPRHAL